MNRHVLPLALVAINLIVAAWIIYRFSIGAGIAFLAVLASVIAGAVVQRFRHGLETSWRARLDPVVLAASVGGLDAVLALAIFTRGA